MSSFKAKVTTLNSEYEKFKRQLGEILSEKLYEKDLATNAQFLKKELKGHITTVSTINENITLAL
jgi:hypothetical protein